MPLPPNEVIERSLELCHYQILKGGVQLQKELAAGPAAGDGRVQPAGDGLINLVVNAIHAMDGGGRPADASARAQRGGDVEIAVADNGPGIPDAIQATLFEPFVTTKPEGKGTGLGLSTVLMVVERHKGRIDFTTSPDGHDLPHHAPRRRAEPGARKYRDRSHAHRSARGTKATARGVSDITMSNVLAVPAVARCVLCETRRRCACRPRVFRSSRGVVGVAAPMVALSGLVPAVASPVLLAVGVIAALALSRSESRSGR